MDDSDSDYDPEVAADLELREQTRRERPGLTSAQFAAKVREVAVGPTVLEMVPCRARCGRTTEWTAEAQHTFDVFNRELAKRGEAPLDKTRIVFCATCKKQGRALEGAASRKNVDAMGALIRELRGGETFPNPPGPAPTPERERQILDVLERAGHPDVVGLRNSLRDSRAKVEGKSRKRDR